MTNQMYHVLQILPFIKLVNISTETCTSFTRSYWTPVSEQNGLALRVQHFSDKAKDLYMVYSLMDYVSFFCLHSVYTSTCITNITCLSFGGTVARKILKEELNFLNSTSLITVKSAIQVCTCNYFTIIET